MNPVMIFPPFWGHRGQTLTLDKLKKAKDIQRGITICRICPMSRFDPIDNPIDTIDKNSRKPYFKNG